MCDLNETLTTDEVPEAKYKPRLTPETGRDICPDDALTLNDVPAITARGQYRDAIDSFLTSMLLNRTEERAGQPLAERSTETYRIESLPEADALVEACDLVLHADAEPDTETDLGSKSRKAVHRVKSKAKEVARGLRAAVDELDSTEDYPESRRPEKTREWNRGGFEAERIRTDGGVQVTFGNADVRYQPGGGCNKVLGFERGTPEYCGNSAKWAVEAGGKAERRCGVHKKDVEAVLE